MKEIFAWATFDGGGSYDLRLYENNETYLDDWVIPLYCDLTED